MPGFRVPPTATVWVALAFALLVADSAWAQPTEEATAETNYLARIAFTSGRNLVKKAVDGRFARAETDFKLYEGDVVRVASSGRVTIVFNPSGIYQSISGGEEFTVSASVQETLQTTDPSRVNQAMIESMHERDQATFAAVGGTRERRDPMRPFPLYPRNTRLFPAEAVELKWEAPDVPPAEYIVILMREGREIGAYRTSATSLRLTRQEVNWQPHTLYYWYVMRADRPRVPAVKPMFQFISRDDESRISGEFQFIRAHAKVGDDALLRSSFAAVQTNEMLYASALKHYRDLYRLSPGDKGLLRQVRELYRRMGFFPEDIDRFVDELRAENPEFAPATDLRADVNGMLVTLTWSATDHIDAVAYRVKWWPAAQPEPEATDENSVLSVRPSFVLPLAPPGKYKIRVISVDGDMGTIDFDVPEQNVVEVEVK